MVFISCSDWAKLHPHGIGYLKILIENGNIEPAQADYIIKQVIIDESGKKYDSDDDSDTCAIEIWSDIKKIPGYFSQFETLESMESRESIEGEREALFQKWKQNLAFMIKHNTIDWSHEKKVFKFLSMEECKKWLISKLENEGFI